VDDDVGAEGLEGEDVCVKATASDAVAAGFGEEDAAGAGEDGAGEGDGAAELGAEAGGEIGLGVFGGVDGGGIAGDADLKAEGAKDFAHDGDIGNGGEVLEDNGLIGQAGDGEGGEGLVFVALGDDFAGDGRAAGDLEAVGVHG